MSLDIVEDAIMSRCFCNYKARFRSNPKAVRVWTYLCGIATKDTGVLKVDGAEVATQKIPRTIPFTMPFDESFL